MVTRLDSYAARVCWNSKGWIYPTGEAAKIESNTYTTERGFGHEEWLFNYEWILDGWKYGFLQPVNRSLAKVEGETIDVRLYTITSDAKWYYVGHLRRCEVLTEKLAESARAEFKRRGWFREMKTQVRRVEGDIEGLNYARATLLFNVRFRQEDAAQYAPIVPVGPKDAIRKLRRYTLVHLDDKLADVTRDWATRVGTTKQPQMGKRPRAGVAPGEVYLVHGQLQADLFALLVKRYGKAAVIMEEGYADLKLRRRGKVTLIEIKSDSRPRYAIREAIGQILEYAYFCERAEEAVTDLVVAAPGEMDDRDAEYLQHLCDARGLPLRYVRIGGGMPSLDL